MARRGLRSRQSGLQQIQRLRVVGVHEPHRAGLTLDLRVAQQVRSLDRAAQGADVQIQHIGAHMTSAALFSPAAADVGPGHRRSRSSGCIVRGWRRPRRCGACGI